MNNKKTLYYDLSLVEIEKIKALKKRPTLGIQVCCGVCASFPLEFLAPYFKVIILFANSNIYPNKEYTRRFEELKRYVDIFNEKYHQDVEIVEFEYNNEEYNKILAPLANEKEGGNRCKLCYETRMDLTYKYADEHNFDYFTTVMTISRQKDSFVLNEIGKRLSYKYKTKYFYSDFKKKKGIDRSTELRKEYNMYNQLYCGCVYSYNQFINKTKEEKNT